MKEVREQQQQQGMYRPEFEHDNCGIGAVVNIKGKKTHETVANALRIVDIWSIVQVRMRKARPVTV